MPTNRLAGDPETIEPAYDWQTGKRRRGWFAKRTAPKAFTAEPTERVRDRRSDFMVAALGITLGLICALFPWYIFFNPDQFGVRAVKLDGVGNTDMSGPMMVGVQPDEDGRPLIVESFEPEKLDLFSTGTATRAPIEEAAAAVAEEQPFPSPPAEYRLVHVANGRAMIEDDAGLTVVGRGARLPDSSTVKAIEQRAGKWVLVTSTDKVFALQP